jgi:hypothetical protein
MRLCACGCGGEVRLWGGKPVRWFMSGCKQRAWRTRQRERALSTWEWARQRGGVIYGN